MSWKEDKPRGDGDPFSDPDEKRVLFAALDSFRQYRKIAHYNVTHRRRQNFYALPTGQWQMLAASPFDVLANLDRVDEAIDSNADIASEVTATAVESFGLQSSWTDWYDTATASDLDKARLTIRQFYRDWSAEGADERRACYGPVLSVIADTFSKVNDKSEVKVLVPGAGLGRLVYEICKTGYTVEGNEISYHQLLASNWVLNHTRANLQFNLYPFALDFSNLVSRKHQLKTVKIPDVHPGTELNAVDAIGGGRMSMTASDFLLLYGDEEHKDMFDAVATVFFIDTAPNVIRYIETIHRCLKAGGTWINLGPLLWHFAERGPAEPDEVTRPSEREEKTGIEAPGSFELTHEELLLLVETMGFDLTMHDVTKDGKGYIQNPDSMLQNIYRPSHWVAKKKVKP
ncbi:MAG: hypothetical protein Q9163_000179 [Psora crenata]